MLSVKITGGFLSLPGPRLIHWAHNPGEWHFSAAPASLSQGGALKLSLLTQCGLRSTYKNANSGVGPAENGTQETFFTSLPNTDPSVFKHRCEQSDVDDDQRPPDSELWALGPGA